MFTPKANSKQKCVKKTQERETRNAVTVQLATSSPRELHQIATQNSGFPLGKTLPFHTKPIFSH